MTDNTPLVNTLRDLADILEYATHLEAQAVTKANDRLMPGGHALVALAPVASPDDYAEWLESTEHKHLTDSEKYAEPDEEADDWEAPLQTLLFWSEKLRDANGYPRKDKPTLASEVGFIRWALDGITDSSQWDRIRADIRATKTRLESLLYAGIRPAYTGAPCMYDECGGKRLIRTNVPTRNEAGEKVWRLTDWHCPACKRQWSEQDYGLNVKAAFEAVQWHVDDAGVTWGSAEKVAKRVNRPPATIRVWVHRGHVATIQLDGRAFVSLEDAVRRGERMGA